MIFLCGWLHYCPSWKPHWSSWRNCWCDRWYYPGAQFDGEGTLNVLNTINPLFLFFFKYTSCVTCITSVSAVPVKAAFILSHLWICAFTALVSCQKPKGWVCVIVWCRCFMLLHTDHSLVCTFPPVFTFLTPICSYVISAQSPLDLSAVLLFVCLLLSPLFSFQHQQILVWDLGHCRSVEVQWFILAS